MAKKEKEIPKSLAEAFSALEKMNEYSAPLAENALSIVNDYINTGSYALNAIVSGSIYKGLPKGRIIGLVGPSGCGKTLIINQVIANAQKADPNMWAVVWDSENAFDAQMARNIGVNVNKVRHNPVETVEECRNQIVSFLEKIEKDKSLHGKIIIVIDSLGNLASTKEIEDAQKGKTATDMGLRAKTIKSMMRSLTNKCAKTNTTLIFSNHVYDDPASLFPSLVKNQSGGKGPLYLASLLIQLASKQEKKDGNDDTESMIPIANRVKGITMRALTVKNRFVPPFLETELYLNFKNGLYKYAGLLDMATAYNVITQNGPTYSLADGTKLGYLKNWKDDTTIWEKKILPALNAIIEKEFTFSVDTTNNENTNAEDTTTESAE